MKFHNLPICLFLAGLWIQFCLVLLPNWLNQFHYDYGWMIPPLVLFLAFQRWQDESPVVESPGNSKLLWRLVFVLTLALIPLRLIEHVDIYWRLPLWIHAFLAFTITHLSLALSHGWKASKSIIPATLFIFLAVPFPSQLELPFVNGLTKIVLDFTSFLLPLNGYPIVTSGSSFIVNNEILDVAEGCSGIRSFQSCLVAGLALGELARFSVSKRLILFLLSLATAVFMNSLRVFTLVLTAYEGGRQEMDAAHDSIGLWTNIIIFSMIALMTWALTRFDLDLRKKPSRPNGTNKQSTQKA